jgi:phosphatidylethanolamine/phosphatidyl-N-methylethanolamine N-methyltransferase
MARTKRTVRDLNESQVTEAYARLSNCYDIVFDKIFDGGRKKILDLLPPPRQKTRVLEVGIGTGLSLDLYPPGWEVVGIDFSEEMLRRAHDKIRKKTRSNVRLLHMDAARIGFRTAAFDAVVAAYVISATPDPLGVLSEMRRVCKPAGTLVFLNHFVSDDPLIAGIERKISRWCVRWGFRTDLELAPLLRDARLHPRTIKRVNALGLWRLVACSNDESAHPTQL